MMNQTGYLLSISAVKATPESDFPRQVQTNLCCEVLSAKSLRQNMQGLVRMIALPG